MSLRSYWLVALTMMLTAFCTNAFATEADCKYNSNVKAAYEQTVDKTEIIDRVVKRYPIEGNFRICTMKFRMKLGNRTYPITESYVFGPDMTENQACQLAEYKAVETLQRAHSKKVFKIQQKYDCVLKNNEEDGIFNTAKKQKVRIWIQGRAFNGWKNVY